MTPLNEEQRKQIEQEAFDNAKAEYSYPNSEHDNAFSRNKEGYIAAAEKYATLCQQKDKEIARLRKALEEIQSFKIPTDTSFASDISKLKSIATKALKQ